VVGGVEDAAFDEHTLAAAEIDSLFIESLEPRVTGFRGGDTTKLTTSLKIPFEINYILIYRANRKLAEVRLDHTASSKRGAAGTGPLRTFSDRTLNAAVTVPSGTALPLSIQLMPLASLSPSDMKQ